MALSTIINRTQSPIYRPPPVNIAVIKIREEEKVIGWAVKEGKAKVLQKKINQILIVTDGQTIRKVIVFEKYSKNLCEGQSYVMRGYALRGSEPPLIIDVTPATQFYKGPKVNVTPELSQKAEDILNPAAPMALLEKAAESKGLMTVQGEIVEFAAVRLVMSGKMTVPIRTVRLKEGSCTMPVSLWREATLVELAIGQRVKITHVRCQDSGYGLQLQSTTFTTIQEKMEDKKAAVVIGVMDTEDENEKHVLLDSDEVFRIAADLWSPFDEMLEDGSLVVDIEIHGNEIKKIIAI